MKPIHSGRLERYLGAGILEPLSQSMRGWYGPPIAVATSHGKVYVGGDGEFRGTFREGGFATATDYMEVKLRKARQGISRGVRRVSRQESAYAGFASLSDLISEATAGGKSQQLLFNKVATTATTAGNAFVARNVGSLPAARGVGGTSGTGVACTNATTGALNFVQPTGGDTTHITTLTVQASVISSLLLFDCLWDMTYNHASSTSTAVDSSNRPTRYQTTDTAPGNFISSEITTVLSATAHTITHTYVDDAGNTAEAATAYAAAASAVAGRTNTPAGTWFVTPKSGDRGSRYLTNIAQSTIASVTGISTFFIGHPLVLVPLPMANMPFVYDGINSAFSLERVYDGANLSFMTPAIATTGAITYNGTVRLVSG